jgi:HSP20 family protein
MNRMFEDVFSGRTEDKDITASTWAPAVDIYETENELVLAAEIPGLEEKDVEIKVEDNTLTLKGERKFEKETSKDNYHRIERSYGSFYRAFTLPNSVDAEKIQAEHENGVLKIIMPKRTELKPRTVKILKPSEKNKK